MRQSDKSRALRLLRLRREGAAFRLNYLLSSPWLWFGVIVIAGFVTHTLVREDGLFLNRAVWLVSGMVIGRILRDWIWLRDVVDAFPFLEKVLNWKIVEDLAAGTGSGPSTDERTRAPE